MNRILSVIQRFGPITVPEVGNVLNNVPLATVRKEIAELRLNGDIRPVHYRKDGALQYEAVHHVASD